MNRFSSNTVLFVIAVVAFLMLFGLLGNTMIQNNRRFSHYQLEMIKRSPYESKAKVTGKYSFLGMAPGFSIEYQFKGQPYSMAVKVAPDVYKKYDVGDTIGITLAQAKPNMAVVGSVLNSDLSD